MKDTKVCLRGEEEGILHYYGIQGMTLGSKRKTSHMKQRVNLLTLVRYQQNCSRREEEQEDFKKEQALSEDSGGILSVTSLSLFASLSLSFPGKIMLNQRCIHRWFCEFGRFFH